MNDLSLPEGSGPNPEASLILCLLPSPAVLTARLSHDTSNDAPNDTPNDTPNPTEDLVPFMGASPRTPGLAALEEHCCITG